MNDLERVLRQANSREKGDDNPTMVDEERPKDWLRNNRSMPNLEGQFLESSCVATNSSNEDDRQTEVHHSVQTSVRESVQRIVMPNIVLSSSEKPILFANRAMTVPVFQPRSDRGNSLVMPGWSEVGRAMQHPDRKEGKSPSMIVRIGVDFGTAFTKVAIRAGADLILVDWFPVTGDDSPTGRYVLPGSVVRTLEGEYCWRLLSECDDLQRNLKLPIIEIAGSNECPTAALAYLALVIRYAKAFLYRHVEVGRKLITRSLRWELNIGCPTEPYEKHEIVPLFRRIARIAWKLATDGNLRESEIAVAWMSDDVNIGLEVEPGVVPEFVAQIAGYIESPQASEGLHALIDIGAATLDVATFNVVMPKNFNSSPKIPIFFSAVRPLGTYYLNQKRHSRLNIDFTWDDGSPIELADAFADRHGKSRSEVEKIDDEFAKQVEKCIFKVIDATRTNLKGDPRSPAWREGLPIFITGGGASCTLFRNAIQKVQFGLKRRMDLARCRFRFIELDSLGARNQSLPVETRCRLTVAIGLTEDAENIARVVPHRDIEPITNPNRERIDHTEIYGD